MAGLTGLEPATSGLTGQRSNQLNYDPASGTDLALDFECGPGPTHRVPTRTGDSGAAGEHSSLKPGPVSVVGDTGFEPVTPCL